MAVSRAFPSRVPAPRTERSRSIFVPDHDGWGSFVIADHVIDAPRQPRVLATGILDHRGMMLLRVAVPIRLPKIGFTLTRRDQPPAEDEAHFLVPEDQLTVLDDLPGEGISHFAPDEVDEVDDPRTAESPA